MSDQTQEWDIVAPNAAALGESIRSMGYSPEAAIADLVDNSITAGAKVIDVLFQWEGQDSYVRVVDDGTGMDEEALVEAMTLGSKNPLEERKSNDLGRFGLGLKTASFSQGRELTVLTKHRSRANLQSVRRWDLDVVSASNEWRLLRDQPSQMPQTSVSGFGTVVQWSKLDRLVGNADPRDNQAQKRFLEIVSRVKQHLEATFHRFLTGRGKLAISLNGASLQGRDPFMTNHPATQALPEEELPFLGELIIVRPYVLPHRSKLSEEDAEVGAGRKGWTQLQGFYVYRSGRLLAQGDWLGIGGSKDEHTKLARIAVEFPASQDGAWQVDVKKATIRPPGELQDQLRRIARSTKSRANEVYRHRGKIVARNASKDFVFAWQAVKSRDGVTHYRINRKHPVVEQIKNSLPRPSGALVESLLRMVEETVPVTMIGSTLSEALDVTRQPFVDRVKDLSPLADFMFTNFLNIGLGPEEAGDRLLSVEPFSQYPEIIGALIESKS